ncbi:FkbM family methyltransferase [Phaeobacter sp.]|uniref:FkbM family methyltransferase n=1 Tax=Phaeobacter sp. TaxID=1902409 RepID=UPI0025E0D1C3|nr:FkbM family methyltransferase [Phaeobacter sp.]
MTQDKTPAAALSPQTSDVPQPQIVASCHGVDVPDSPYLNETRIRRINESRYEREEIAGVLSVVGPDDRVLEVGAGIGLVGAIAAKACHPETVLSFEGNPQLIPVIRDLYATNGLESRISVRNAILVAGADQPKSMPFHIRKSYLGSSLLNPGQRPSQVVDVPTADFSTVCQVLNPTVLVMDIEGGELELLQNIDLTGFRAVVIEFHPDVYGVPGMRSCKRALLDAGFVKQEDVSTRKVWTCVRS